MAKYCEHCNSKRTKYVRTTKNIYDHDMTLYRCSDCGSTTKSVRIPNTKEINIGDIDFKNL